MNILHGAPKSIILRFEMIYFSLRIPRTMPTFSFSFNIHLNLLNSKIYFGSTRISNTFWRWKMFFWRTRYKDSFYRTFMLKSCLLRSFLSVSSDENSFETQFTTLCLCKMKPCEIRGIEATWFVCIVLKYFFFFVENNQWIWRIKKMKTKKIHVLLGVRVLVSHKGVCILYYCCLSVKKLYILFQLLSYRDIRNKKKQDEKKRKIVWCWHIFSPFVMKRKNKFNITEAQEKWKSKTE